jgi:dephospho-CoA kinase
MPKIILGLAGEMASGKGTSAKYIVEKYAGNSHRFSTMLRDVLGRLYLDQSRENMSRLSTIVRENFGEDALAKVVAEDVKRGMHDYVAVDGVRRLADIKYLKEIPQFKLVYIETDMRVAYDRLVKRGENTDDYGKTFEEFQKEHELETELQIKGLKEFADYVVDNNGTLEDLHMQFDKILMV